MHHQSKYQLEDKELILLYREEGDNHAMGVLLERYSLLTFGVCMKYLKEQESAKDAVQQIFMKVLAELSKYEVDYFKSWLYMVAKNHCLMQLRAKKFPLAMELNEGISPCSNEAENWEMLMKKEKTFLQLESALLLLHEDQRNCVHLFYLQKKSYREIAEITGFSLMQVKSNIQNGKRNIRIHLERSNDND